MFGKNSNKPKAVEITDQNFQELVLDQDNGVYIDFWAPWCGPCKVMGPIVDEIAGQFQGQELVIGKVNVDQNPGLSEAFGIRSIPTSAFIKQKKLIERIPGLIPKPNLEEMISDLIAFQFEEEEE